jgi:hypothetical protein
MNYPEIKPDMNKAMTMAASAQTPQGRAIAPALMANFIPKDITPIEKENLRLREEEIAIQRANANRGSFSPTMTDQGLVVINSKTGQPQLVTDANGKPFMGQASSALGKEFTELNQQKSIINGVLKGVEGNRDAFGPLIGAKGMLPFGDVAQNRKFTPAQLEARSEVFNTASAVIKERAGTAQSASEKETIMRFLPSPLDSADVIIGKMNGYNRYIQNKEAGTTSVRGAVPAYYGKTSKELESTVTPAATTSQAQSAPIYANNGKERIVSTDGGVTWKPAGSQ